MKVLRLAIPTGLVLLLSVTAVLPDKRTMNRKRPWLLCRARSSRLRRKRRPERPWLPASFRPKRWPI